MPYYSWTGIDLKGQLHKGQLFARTPVELDALLIKHEIALLNCKQKKQFLAFAKINLLHKIQFFRQLYQMINCGVLLPDSLMVVGSQMHHVGFQQIISQLAQDICQGQALSQAMGKYPEVFDTIMVKMIQAGEESGSLNNSLNMLCEYLDARHEFNKRLRSALMVPIISFGFFCLIALVIFIFIVPQFMEMFQAVNKELPLVTQYMLMISDTLRSKYAFVLAGFLALMIIISSRAIKSGPSKYAWDSFIIKTPLIGILIKESSLSYFLHAVSMLLAGGMQLLPAMKIAKQTVSSSVLRSQLDYIEQEIEAGSSLSQAMMHDRLQIFSAEIVSIVRVAEESGQLSPLLARAAYSMQEQVKRMIAVLTILINPLLMLVLGLLITFLIFAVYLPIFNLSSVIST
jgi:type IV pilus assembly protein PilC